MSSGGGTQWSFDPKNWASILREVRGPLGLLALVALVNSTVVLVVIISGDAPGWSHGIVAVSSVFLSFAIVGAVAVTTWYKPAHLLPPPPPREPGPEDEMASARPGDGELESLVQEQGGEVLYAGDEQRPALSYWFRELRPNLHQAAHYSVPTYYLDTKLNVIDWNIAFGVMFADLAGQIRGRHVNWLIARLANHDQVFDHARRFTHDVIENGAFPYVDMEPICYQSTEFGLIEMVKVAVQLTDTHGVEKGWAVALLPKKIDWDKFAQKLFDRIHADKRWSVYSASYDRILLRFPPYKQLIDDVVSVVPHGNLSVADLGAGTGNVSGALIERGHRVTAIEDNLGMLDRFAAKPFNPEAINLIKSSVEHLEFLRDESFDAVVMVNVLYALERPLECLRHIHRILRPNGVLGLSTTHRETSLDQLLGSIENHLNESKLLPKLAADWDTVYKVNRNLERSEVRRFTRDEIREMLALASFTIIKDVPSTYEGAVMLLHARKQEPSSAMS